MVGMSNVAFEMHPYPGHFGWGKPGLAVHKGWLQCVGEGDNVCKWKTKLEGLDTALRGVRDRPTPPRR